MAAEQTVQETGEQVPAKTFGKRKNVVMLGVLVGVMLAEAVVVFVLVKHFAKAASPPDANAQGPGGLVASEGSKAEPELEVRIGDFKVQNRKGQAPCTVSFVVFATVPPAGKPAKEHQEKKEEGGEGDKDGSKVRAEDAAVTAKAAKIKDRFTRVIRSLEPECFAEVDLATLRAKLKEELGDVMGADFKIREILLTDFSCSPDE